MIRDWLQYELGVRREMRRIRARQARAGRARARARDKRRPAPRWLVTLDLLLGALVLAGKVSPAWWIALAFAVILLLVLVVALWHYLAILAGALALIWLVRRYLAYRRAAAEVPY